MIIKTFLFTGTVATVLLLMGCSHQSKTDASQTTQAKLNDFGSLVWKCPAVSFTRQNPDGTIDDWGMCATEFGKTLVYLNRGAITPLGELVSSEEIAARTFNSHTQGETFTSDPINYVSYSVTHDPKTISVGYEVTFAECALNDFTLYIRDKEEDGALEALQYTLKTMKHSSYCNL